MFLINFYFQNSKYYLIQKCGTEGFFQLNSLLRYVNTTILLVDSKENNIMYKISVEDQVQQRFFSFLFTLLPRQIDAVVQNRLPGTGPGLQSKHSKRQLCIRLHNLYFRVRPTISPFCLDGLSKHFWNLIINLMTLSASFQPCQMH